jgi:hypothetical protein
MSPNHQNVDMLGNRFMYEPDRFPGIAKSFTPQCLLPMIVPIQQETL